MNASTGSDLEGLLARVPLFADLGEGERAAIVPFLRLAPLAEGEVLFKQGAPADGLYLVRTGKLRVSARRFGEEDVLLSELGPGSALGEVALIDRQPRSAGARAAAASEVAFLDVRSFDALRAGRHPSALKLMLRIGRGFAERIAHLHGRAEGTAGGSVTALASSRAVTETDRQILRALPGFAALTDDDLARLGAQARVHDASRGTVLAESGGAPDRLFIVLRGALELRASPAPDSDRHAVLGPGALTTEIASLSDQPRAVTTAVREAGTFLSLPATALEALLGEGTHLAFELAERLTQAAAAALRVASRRHARLAAVAPHTSSA